MPMRRGSRVVVVRVLESGKTPVVVRVLRTNEVAAEEEEVAQAKEVAVVGELVEVVGEAKEVEEHRVVESCAMTGGPNS